MNKKIVFILLIIGVALIAIYFFVIKPVTQKKDTDGDGTPDDEENIYNVQGNEWKDLNNGKFKHISTGVEKAASGIKAIRPVYKRVFGNEWVEMPGAIMIELKKHDSLLNPNIIEGKINRTQIYEYSPGNDEGLPFIEKYSLNNSVFIKVEIPFIDNGGRETVNGKERKINRFPQTPQEIPYLDYGYNEFI